MIAVKVLNVLNRVAFLIASQPSHHIPYLYSLAGAASKSQERVREIAMQYYNNTIDGLAGVGFKFYSCIFSEC